MLGSLSNYTLVSKIADGTTCEIMQAVDANTGQEVAIKIINEQFDYFIADEIEAM